MHSASRPFPLPFLVPSSATEPLAALSPSPRFPISSAAFSSAGANTSAVCSDDSAVAAYWDYQFLFLSQRSESPNPIVLRPSEGSIPADFPDGTYYLVGPGLFSDDHGSTVHPLDGHGYLRAFDFAGGEARYSARYVETEAEKEERDEETGRWRFTHRGPFSVLKGGKRVGNAKVMKNVANTSVVRWSGRLLCFWEGGNPYEINPETLGTLGAVNLVGNQDRAAEDRSTRRRWDFRGLGLDLAAGFLKQVLQGVFKMPAKRLLSHYKIDAARNRLLVLSCNAEDMLLPRANFTFYEFDGDFELQRKKEFVVDDHLIIHDWAFTENYYVLIGNRIKLDVPGSLLAVSGMSPMISALSVNPDQTTTPIYLFPRSPEDRKRDWRVPVEAPMQLWLQHVGNAFEESGRGGTEIQLQVAACSYHWFNFQKMFGYDWRSGRLDPSFMNVAQGKEALLPHLFTISIELDSEGRWEQCSIAEPSERWSCPADFPAINPTFSGRRNAYVYAGTSSGSRRFLPHFPFDAVVKLNVSDGSAVSWWAGDRRFVGEPIFVPKGHEEDDGYVLVVEYVVSKQRCYLVILDARRMGEADAVRTKLEVPKHLNFPIGFHGFWASR